VARHLIIGASGQVGEYLLSELGDDAAGTYFEHARPGLTQLDARDRDAVRALLHERRPEIVYLTASEPNVDLCEREPEQTRAINVGSVETVTSAAREAAVSVVFFSSDYVFDGEGGPYTEEDEPRPLSEYGRQKLEGERLTLATPGSLVVRTAVVYGPERQGKNFVVRLVNGNRNGDRWHVPTDQISSPTYAPNLAHAVIELARRGVTGIVHVAGPQAASRYEFALEVARVFGLDASLIEPVTTDELGQDARRPLSAALSVDKARGLIRAPLVPFPEGLRRMARTI
jgi:dTDP-4-dehydrorhamnose reductase